MLIFDLVSLFSLKRMLTVYVNVSIVIWGTTDDGILVATKTPKCMEGKVHKLRPAFNEENGRINLGRRPRVNFCNERRQRQTFRLTTYLMGALTTYELLIHQD